MKPMTNRRILRTLEDILESDPAWDADALAFCRRHGFVETVQVESMAADCVTPDGMSLVTPTETHFARLLSEKLKLRRPDTNGTNEDHHTHQQKRRHAKAQAKQGQKEVDR